MDNNELMHEWFDKGWNLGKKTGILKGKAAAYNECMDLIKMFASDSKNYLLLVSNLTDWQDEVKEALDD